MTRLIGAGGGGGSVKGGGNTKARTPTEARDGLNSTAYAKVIDLLCEGEIEGFPSARQYTRGTNDYNRALLKDVFFNNTPVLSQDASISDTRDSDYNFQGVTVEARYGTQTQNIIEGFSEILEEIPVGATVEKNLPATRTIVDPNVDAVRVIITLPALQEFEDDGDIGGTSVRIQIDAQYAGGGYNTVIDDTFSGRTADQYQRDFRYTFTSPERPVDIRVIRLTDDSNTAKLQDLVVWTSYTEIVTARLNYPNTALVGLRVDAEQFSSIPQRAYRIRGRKVAIPDNGTVDETTGRITYSGMWGGSFQSAKWTTDPAWCLWDLLTSSRYGAGDFLNTGNLDKFSFYAASQYCSELIPSGFGHNEPRFSLNAVIQTEDDAYNVINQLCSVFRAMPYWASGSLTISQDRPGTAAYLFNPTNVIDGFSYSSSDLKTRATIASVSWFDMDARDKAIEVVEDPVGIAAYGIIRTDVDAFGCTSRGQARRVGEWLLYTNRYESEIVQFTASIEAGVIVRPGQQIRISDPTRAGQRMGGRVMAATTTAVTVDGAAPAFVSGAQLMAVLPNGTVETVNVNSISGNVINCNAFSTAPAANSVWVYQQPGLLTSNWRVIGVREVDACKYEVTALAQNGSKYSYIERDTPLRARDITQLDERPASPAGLAASEVIYNAGSRAAVKLVVTWRVVPGIRQYRIRWRVANGNWEVATVARQDYEILDAINGSYDVEVSAVSSTYNISPPSTLVYAVQGKVRRPRDIAGLTVTPIDGKSATLSWQPISDLDVRVGGKIIIRHSPLLSGALWGRGQELVPSAAGSQTQKVVPLVTGTYMVKAEDDTGNRSVNAALFVVNRPVIDNSLIVATSNDAAALRPWPGNGTFMHYDAALAGLVLSGGTLIDSIASIDALGQFDEELQYAGAGEYVCERVVDLGDKYAVDIVRAIDVEGIEFTGLWDAKSDLIDLWSEIDGSNVERANCITLVRSTNDNPRFTPTWTEWSEFVNATVIGRALQFKIQAFSDAPGETLLVKQFDVTGTMAKRSESQGPFTTELDVNSEYSYTSTFENAFFEAPLISVSATSGVLAGYYPSTTASPEDVKVSYVDGSGASQAATYTVTATGYGRRIP